MNVGFITRGVAASLVGVTTKADVLVTYETIAASFAATRREPWPEVLEFIDSLPPRSRVLDIGCGNGRHVATLAARDHRALGVDFSRRLLSLGRDEARFKGWAGRVEWVEAEAASLPFDDEAFSACLCVAVLHHLPTRVDRLAALAEIRRVLSVDGCAFLSVWALEQPRFQAIVESRRTLGPETWGDVTVPWTMPDGRIVERYYHLFREGELEQLIIESGLHGETFFRGSGNYSSLARKDG